MRSPLKTCRNLDWLRSVISISQRPLLFWVDISFRKLFQTQIFGQFESVSAIRFYLCAGDHEQPQCVPKFDIVSSFLKPIDNPIPVDCRFDADLDISPRLHPETAGCFDVSQSGAARGCKIIDRCNILQKIN